MHLVLTQDIEPESPVVTGVENEVDSPTDVDPLEPYRKAQQLLRRKSRHRRGFCPSPRG